MAAFPWVLIWFIGLYIAEGSGNMKTMHGSETECFHTVSHYYSNPSITGKSVLYFSYKNDFLKSTIINITCPDSELGLFLQLDSIKLAMPATKEDFCVESKTTNFTSCKLSSQCECCAQPKRIHTSDINNVEHYRRFCDGKTECSINVTSQFFDDCALKNYECHSRWAQVLYTCKPHYDSTTQSSATTEGNIPIRKPTNMIWLIFAPATIVMILTVVSIICWKRYRLSTKKQQRNDPMEKKVYASIKSEDSNDNSERETFIQTTETVDTNPTARNRNICQAKGKRTLELRKEGANENGITSSEIRKTV